MALFMGLVMLGFLAFALDVGYLFHVKRMAQGAADAAAVAAAEEAGNGSTAETNAAGAAAQMNGFPASSVTLTSVSGGNYSSNGSSPLPTTWVQATISQPVPTFFLAGFNRNMASLTVTASAVAGDNQSSPTCVCLEGSTGQDLNMSNNAKLTANSCGITVDSNSSNAVGVVGSASVCGLSLGTVSTTWDNSGNINNNGSICSATKIVQGTTACTTAMPVVPVDTNCTATSAPSSWTAAYSTGPNSTYGTTQGGNTVCYNGLTVNGNGMVTTLNPGIYVINGGQLHFESGTNGGGNGVMFYLTNGASLVIDNGANVNLVAGGNAEDGGGTAPNVGTSSIYNNILIYQDPGTQAANNLSSDTGDTQPISIQGGSSAYLNGAIYAPLAPLTLGNGSASTVDTDVVAQSLTMNGGGTLTSTSATNMGTLNTSVAKVTQ
jgi:hypothetical protein